MQQREKIVPLESEAIRVKEDYDELVETMDAVEGFLRNREV